MFGDLIGKVLFISVGLNFILAFSLFKNKAEYVLDLFKLHKKGYVTYKLTNGLFIKSRANSQDKIIILETNGKREYTKHFDIGSNDIVFDIGAHIGSFSLLAAKLANDGMVFSFEPEENNYNLLKENITINQFQNIKPFNIAVTDNISQSVLNYSSKNTGGHSLILKNDGKNNKEVASNTLENILEQNNIDRIDFLKIDTEGSEYQIIYSIPDLIFHRIKKIALEFHEIDEKRNGHELEAFLELKNYKVHLKKFPGAGRGMLYAKLLDGINDVSSNSEV